MKDSHFYLLLGLGGFVAYSIALKAKAFAGDAVQSVNPINHDNIFSSGVNAVGDILDDGVSDDSFSLGSAIYDLIHGSDEL